MYVFGGHRTAPLLHTAEPSLDAEFVSLQELVAAKANLNVASPGRSVLLSGRPFSSPTRFAMVRGKPLARTTTKTGPEVAGRLPKVVHLWTCARHPVLEGRVFFSVGSH